MKLSSYLIENTYQSLSIINLGYRISSSILKMEKNPLKKVAEIEIMKIKNILIIRNSELKILMLRLEKGL